MCKEISDARTLIWSVLLAILVVSATGVQGKLLYRAKSVFLDFVSGAKANWSTSPGLACTAITSKQRVGLARARRDAIYCLTISSKLYWYRSIRDICIHLQEQKQVELAADWRAELYLQILSTGQLVPLPQIDLPAALAQKYYSSFGRCD